MIQLAVKLLVLLYFQASVVAGFRPSLLNRNETGAVGNVGSVVKLECLIKNLEDPRQVIWLRENGKILAVGDSMYPSNNVSRFTATMKSKGDEVTEYTLEISDSKRTDGGHYYCGIRKSLRSFELFDTEMKKYVLVINFTQETRRNNSHTIPHVGVLVQNQTAVAGKSVEFQCIIRNYLLQPNWDVETIVWFKNPHNYVDSIAVGEMLYLEDPRFESLMTEVNGTDMLYKLKIRNVRRSDQGFYVCEDSKKTMKTTFNVEVRYNYTEGFDTGTGTVAETMEETFNYAIASIIRIQAEILNKMERMENLWSSKCQ